MGPVVEMEGVGAEDFGFERDAKPGEGGLMAQVEDGFIGAGTFCVYVVGGDEGRCRGSGSRRWRGESWAGKIWRVGMSQAWSPGMAALVRVRFLRLGEEVGVIAGLGRLEGITLGDGVRRRSDKGGRWTAPGLAGKERRCAAGAGLRAEAGRDSNLRHSP